MPSFEPHGERRKRYAAKVEKGDNAWKREWNSFVSGLTLKRVRDGSINIALRTADDLQEKTKEPRASGSFDSSRPKRDKDDSSLWKSREDALDSSGLTFSYLFNTPADRKVAREAKQKAHSKGDRSDSSKLHQSSKHQQAILEGKARGLNVEGMTRKEVRNFLRLTRTKEQEEAEQHAKEFKLHHLLDEKLAWYQQGPSPIDLISENLVTRKAEKKGKRLGLRYNYLIPHPSWIARRAQRRRESILVGLGRRFVFDEATGVAMDPIRNMPVDLTKVSLTFTRPLLPSGEVAAAVSTEARPSVSQDSEEHSEGFPSEDNTSAGVPKRLSRKSHSAEERSGTRDSTLRKGKARGAEEAQALPSASNTASPCLSILMDDAILVDPLASRNSLTRAVVRSRAAAEAIRKANLTTNYLSSSLLGGTNATGI